MRAIDSGLRLSTEIWPQLGYKSSNEKVDQTHCAGTRRDENRKHPKMAQKGPHLAALFILKPCWTIITLEILYDMSLILGQI